MICLFLFASECGQQPSRNPFGNFWPLAGCQPQAGWQCYALRFLRLRTAKLQEYKFAVWKK